MKIQSSMMMVSFAALALCGCGKTSEPTSNQTAVAPMNSGNAIAPAPLPQSESQTFVSAMAASDKFEIESSKLAETNSQSASVKQFAKSMIQAHTRSGTELAQAANSASPAINPMPLFSSEQRQTLDALKQLQGKEFDVAYMSAQENGHHDTIAKLKAYSANGEDPSLKQFSAKLLPIVTAHLNMAKGLDH